MLTHPSVMITLIICATLTAVAALAGVVFLVYTGNDAAAIGALLGGPFLGLLLAYNKRLSNVQESVKTLQQER